MIMLGVCFFVCGAQTAFAAGSIPVQVLTYENGDLDNAEKVWEGTYTPPAGGNVPITKAAGAFASKAPDGYSFGVAAVMNGKVDTSIYQVEEIDVKNDMYRLADNTTYNIFPEDYLSFYYYKAAVDMPVYWCQSDLDGSLKELTDAEYKALTGNETRVNSITVPDDRAASLAPAEAADILTGDPDADDAGIEAYVIGRDGLLATPLQGASSEGDKDAQDAEDEKVYFRLGGESTDDTAYKIDSDVLLLKNSSTGIAFAGVSLAGLKTDSQDIDTSIPVVSPADYEMISGSPPAIYVVYENQSGIVPLASGVTEDGSGAIPWLIAGSIATLILILLVVLIIFLRARRKAKGI